MVGGCGDRAAVPQYFKDRLDDFAQNFLVLRDYTGFKFDVYIDRRDHISVMCGPYWKLFAKTHHLKPGDSVRFFAVEHGTAFQAVVEGQVDVFGQDAAIFGLPEVGDDVRHLFHSIVFTDIDALRDGDVRKILGVLEILHAYVDFLREFMVHRMTDVDMASGVFEIPMQIRHALKIPHSGHASLNSPTLIRESVAVEYKSTLNGSTFIIDQWGEFCTRVGINNTSVLLVELDTMTDYLHLRFYIIHP